MRYNELLEFADFKWGDMTNPLDIVWTPEEMKEHVFKHMDFLRAHYPRTAQSTFYTVQSYLSLYDPKRVPYLEGSCSVPHGDWEKLTSAMVLIAGMLEQELRKVPAVQPTIKDVMIRKHLELPPLVIEGEAVRLCTCIE